MARQRRALSAQWPNDMISGLAGAAHISDELGRKARPRLRRPHGAGVTHLQAKRDVELDALRKGR